MRLLLLSVLVTCLQFHGSQAQDRVCENATFPQELKVKERSPNGTVILNISDHDDLEQVKYSSPTPPPFIDVSNGTVYLNTILDIDSNKIWCSQYVENGLRWQIHLKCRGNTKEHPIDVIIITTDDFPPEFTVNFTQTIQEMLQIGSVVNRVGPSQVIDRDCLSNVQLGSTTSFAIENGNTRGTFRLTDKRSGVMVVNRSLDYENGDRQFYLNISVTDVNAPNKTSYGTLEVNVTDIDDNDPAFSHPGYVLHVQEENASSVGVWTQTVPPVSVFDPDVDAVPKDPLVISLLNSSDASIVEVNETTGNVRLKRTFDHEQKASHSVVLKVQQTVSTFRSSTATLTVLVDDINDNRPSFRPHTYNVTMAEHSASGTSVVLVSATDRDSGDNAMFNYTLESERTRFSLTTEQIGQVRIGVLSVRDAALLDREVSPQVTVTIGTAELTATDGQDCTGVQCKATVTISLLDINDNSPVFGHSHYVVVVHSYTPHFVIITVNASDADQGPNAALTYTLQSYSATGCGADVIIDPDSGDVSLNNTVTQSGECPVLVTACDNPTDPSQRRCTSVPLQVSVHVGNGTVRIEAPVPPNVLRPEWTTLQRELSSVLGVTVTIKDILIHTDPDRSYMYISAQNASTREKLPADKLQLLVDAKADEIAALFAHYIPATTASLPPVDDKPKDDSGSDISLLVIILIVVASVLLLAFLVSIVYIHKGHRSQKRQKRLNQRLSTPNELYDNLAKAENGSATLIHDADEDMAGGTEFTNPVFQDDTTSPSSPEVTSRTDSSQDTSSVDGRERSETATTELPERLPDTDSGVPSDRENGAGDSGSDSSKQATPVMARTSDPGAAGRSGGSAYLDAVLSSTTLLKSGDNVDGPDDMVDVTAPPSDHEIGSAGTDGSALDSAAGPSPSPSPSLSPSSPTYVNVSFGGVLEGAAPSYMNVGPSVLQSGVPPDLSAGYEEQENTMTFADNDTGEDEKSSGSPSPTPNPALQPVLNHLPQLSEKLQGPDHNPDAADNDEDDEEPGVGSRLGLLVRPSTPPMQKRSNIEEEEEEELPDEPEPDYAKKVRFSSEVVQHDTVENKNGVDSNGEANGDGRRRRGPLGLGNPSEHSGLAKPIEEIDGSPIQLHEEDEPTFHFNVQEEMTCL